MKFTGRDYMGKEDFFKSIIITEEEKKRANYYIEVKGLYVHILIRDLLLNYGIEGVSYKEIATVYRYDKRIRKILFKYIAYLEEYFRAFILNNYKSMEKQNFWLQAVDQNNVVESIEKLTFKKLIEQLKNFPNNSIILPKSGHLVNNLSALVIFRNAVYHNRFLLLYLGFEKCYNNENNISSASLRSNLLNLAEFLPSAVKNNFLKDVAGCKEFNDKVLTNNKVKSDLPKQVIIDL